MKYFTNCKTAEELKKEYHRLARENHPDLGGDTATMQQINAEFEKAAERIASGYTMDDQNAESAADIAEFASVLNILFGLGGIEIELCGTWLWITGSTYAHKDAIKAAGCKWSAKKKAWYYHSGEYTRKSRKGYSMDEIRDLHGSKKLNGNGAKRLATA